VAQLITSADDAAASKSAATLTGHPRLLRSCATAAAFFGSLPHTSADLYLRTARWPSMRYRDSAPVPTINRTSGSEGASRSAASADTAAVRSSVNARPSIIASGCPVSHESSRYAALTVGILRSAFSGNTVVILTPSAPCGRHDGMSSRVRE
jgi:hypothetical protein